MCVNTDGKCRACGSDAEKFKNGKSKSVCGDECRKMLKSRKSSRYNAKNPTTKKKRVCIGCGIEFFMRRGSNRKGLYHSRECAWKNNSHYANPTKLREWTAEKNARIQKDREASAVSNGMVYWLLRWNSCIVCSVMFLGAKARKVNVCGQRCRQEANRRMANQHYRKLVGNERKCDGCGIVIKRDCKRMCVECLRQRKRQQRKAQKLRRHAMKFNNGPVENIKPIDVFERDQWMCGLCKRECSIDAAVPNPLAATVDHVLPLSNGGTHTMSNVQCACYECNWRKSDNAIEVDGEIVWEYKWPAPRGDGKTRKRKRDKSPEGQNVG